MRRGALLGLMLVLALVAASCGGDDEGGTITIDGQNANDHGTKDVSGETSVEFEMDDFYFEPHGAPGHRRRDHHARRGQRGPERALVHLGGARGGRGGRIGRTATIEITFPDSGQVDFHCKYHADQGMRGAVEVA